MDLKFVEAGNGFNWGKFAVGRFTDDEWFEPALYPGREEPSLITGRGWTREHVQVFDLQTGEGAMFRLGAYPTDQLTRHRIWVCPLFEPFLQWLYDHVDTRPQTWWDDLPRTLELLAAPAEVYGYRRPGPDLDDELPALATVAARPRCVSGHQRGDNG